MSIGPDIKEVLAEVGIGFTIVRDSGDITGGYFTSKPNTQVTKPFIQEFFLEARLSYDTVAVVGDIIQLDVTSDIYIVMNKAPRLFENAVFENNCILYKCNATANILRPSDVRGDDYHMRTIWEAFASGINVLITTPLYGHSLEADEELGLIGLELHELYIPSSVGIRSLDRIRISSSEYYRVETVKKRRYSAVDVVQLGEDVRPTSTSTTTTSSTSSTTTTTTA
jgi:hypothetical protein